MLVLDKMFDEGVFCKFFLFVLFVCDIFVILLLSNFVYDGDVQYEDSNNILLEVFMLFGQVLIISCCINCLMNISCKVVEICLILLENKCWLSKGLINIIGIVVGVMCK